MIEPVPPSQLRSGSGTPSAPIRSPTGTPFDAQPGPAAVVRLHEHTDGPAVLDDAGGRADAALEAVADHAGAAADGPLLDCAAVRARKRRRHVLRRDVEAVDVVEEAVPGLADDGQAPAVAVVAVLCRRDERVADDADRVRVRERDRRRQQPGVPDPLQAGQLAVAVDPVRACEERLRRRHDDRHSGADVLTLDQRRVADADRRRRP